MSKEIKITDKMKKDIKKYEQYFDNLVMNSHTIHYLNGFIGVGRFAIPQDHITKGCNTIWVYNVAFNRNATKIKVHCSLELTFEEAEDLMKCLKITLARNKEELKNDKENNNKV